MNKKCVFSIVAKNYIGLATILGNSIIKYDDDIDFYIIVADEFADGERSVLITQNVLVGKEVLDYSAEQWKDMSFKYDLTAFCTAIKPASFQYLYSLGYEKVIYFDPDIYVFSSITPIFEILEKHSVVVVPHVAGLHINYTGEHPESSILWHGIFNFGFCGTSKSYKTDLMLEWWKQRLIDKGFADAAGRYFYDQKWIDMCMGFFDADTFHVTQHLGMNMAPWNYFEREVIKHEDGYYVRFRGVEESKEYKLIFIHFAGYNYPELKKGNIQRLRLKVNDYDDINAPIMDYVKALNDEEKIFDHYIKLPYTYGVYTNGAPVERFQRSLYHGLFKRGYNFENPFNAKGDYYMLLQKNGMYSKNGNRADKLTMGNIPNLDKKKGLLDKGFILLYKILGYERYFTLVRALNLYTLQENHAFLLEKDAKSLKG